MNWLERARREIGADIGTATANTAERNLTAVTAVLDAGLTDTWRVSIVSNGSSHIDTAGKFEAVREAFAERAAIMEFDAGLSRQDAEVAAARLVSTLHEAQDGSEKTAELPQRRS